MRTIQAKIFVKIAQKKLFKHRTGMLGNWDSSRLTF